MPPEGMLQGHSKVSREKSLLFLITSRALSPPPPPIHSIQQTVTEQQPCAEESGRFLENRIDEAQGQLSKLVNAGGSQMSRS